MAAEALQAAAKEKNVELKVETRGSVGVENALTADEIAQAHAIIIAADMEADEDRFKGKPIVRVGAAAAIKDPNALIDQALAMKAATTDYLETVKKAKAEKGSANRSI